MKCELQNEIKTLNGLTPEKLLECLTWMGDKHAGAERNWGKRINFDCRYFIGTAFANLTNARAALEKAYGTDRIEKFGGVIGMAHGRHNFHQTTGAIGARTLSRLQNRSAQET